MTIAIEIVKGDLMRKLKEVCICGGVNMAGDIQYIYVYISTNMSSFAHLNQRFPPFPKKFTL